MRHFNNCEIRVIMGVRIAGYTISETDNLLGFSEIIVSPIFKEYQLGQKTWKTGSFWKLLVK